MIYFAVPCNLLNNSSTVSGPIVGKIRSAVSEELTDCTAARRHHFRDTNSGNLQGILEISLLF